MDFIMHVLRKQHNCIGFLLIITFMIGMLPIAGYANDFAVKIRHAQISMSADQYALNAGFDFHLSPKAKKALQNGIPLYWNLRVRLVRQRHFWWDKTLAKVNFSYRIQYHALLNRYRVQNISTGEIYNFSSLAAALDVIANVEKLLLIDQKAIEPGKQYGVKLKLNFVREKLPLPLRPSSYLDSQWYLSSDWFICPLQK